MISRERIHRINDKDIRKDGGYILYWMQAAQRVEWNHALEFAIEQSNRYAKPLVVYFGLTDGYPEANLRHYRFLLEGLADVKKSLETRGIRFILLHTEPDLGALKLAQEAVVLVTDRGYVRIERTWREEVAQKAPCLVVEVETNLVVPVEETSIKAEYAAATIRKRIHRKLPSFNQLLRTRKVFYPSLLLSLPLEELSLSDLDGILSTMDIDHDVPVVEGIPGGTTAAKERLEDFLCNKLEHYAVERNQPGQDFGSGLSPYLHFGQISPLYILREVAKVPGKNSEAFLEELIIRRELAFNFVWYQRDYDAYSTLPDWARKSLGKHQGDERPILYDRKTLEQARTHDPYWNAAQEELLRSGVMHNYMRMYWGKKILEWSSTPEEAFERALSLNNRYALDGRDPNSFAGVAWCFGLHDRPWQERSIFGMVRYMNAAGLERKFRMQEYLDRVKSL